MLSKAFAIINIASVATIRIKTFSLMNNTSFHSVIDNNKRRGDRRVHLAFIIQTITNRVNLRFHENRIANGFGVDLEETTCYNLDTFFKIGGENYEEDD